MQTKLTMEEKGLLEEKFRLLFELPEEAESVPGVDFFSETSLLDFLEANQERIGSRKLKVAASIFMKRYAFLAAAYWFSFSVFNKKLEMDPASVALVHREKNNLWLPGFYVTSEAVSVSADREQEREEAARNMFSGHLSLLVEHIRKATKLEGLISWENIAVYLFWLYETGLEDSTLAPVHDRLEEDFRWLFKRENGAFFGDYHANPLHRYYVEKRLINGKMVRPRTSCCFSYLLEKGGHRCKTCPQICYVKC